jgi:hypothetical protein
MNIKLIGKSRRRFAFGLLSGFYLLAVVMMILAPAAMADIVYDNWLPCGNGVSVSIAQVDSATWTWKFRNDGDDTITYMDFWYTDITGKNYDVFPFPLQPGTAFGGWGTFTAASSPTIQLKTVQRGNSSTSANGPALSIPPQAATGNAATTIRRLTIRTRTPGINGQAQNCSRRTATNCRRPTYRRGTGRPECRSKCHVGHPGCRPSYPEPNAERCARRRGPSS